MDIAVYCLVTCEYTYACSVCVSGGFCNMMSLVVVGRRGWNLWSEWWLVDHFVEQVSARASQSGYNKPTWKHWDRPQWTASRKEGKRTGLWSSLLGVTPNPHWANEVVPKSYPNNQGIQMGSKVRGTKEQHSILCPPIPTCHGLGRCQGEEKWKWILEENHRSHLHQSTGKQTWIAAFSPPPLGT